MRNLRSRRQRAGTTAVEFAIVAPIVFLLFFAGFEFCRVAMVRHTADNAVYEGARVGIIPGATVDEVDQAARNIMTAVGINTFDVNVIPAVFTRETVEVTVRIEVPLDANTFIPHTFTAGQTVTRELTLRREGKS